jgi:hypothetical protein
VRLPKGESAKEENKRLAANSSLMCEEMIIWAWTCLRCSMVVELSARNVRVGEF